MNCDLPHLGGEYISFNTNDIANIQQSFKYDVVCAFVFSGADVITLKIKLDLSAGVLQLHESSSTHDPAAHDPAGNADVLKKFYIIWIIFQDL